MDQNTAQPNDVQTGGLPPEIPPGSISPVKKILPFILGGVLILLLLLGSIMLFSSSSSGKKIAVTPTPRPTATPFPPPAIPLVTKSATDSSSLRQEKTGRLAFIKNGDIYHSDFESFSLLVKNATPAADKLSWSPGGNYLVWRSSSTEATPSALVIYDKNKKTSYEIKPDGENKSELVDYIWSPDEKKIAALYKNTNYKILIYTVSPAKGQKSEDIINRSVRIKELIWPNNNKIIFLGEDGINSLDINSTSSGLLVNSDQVQKIKLSPKKDKLLYSIGNDTRSELYLIDIDGKNNRPISHLPIKIDMGTTNLPLAILQNGFLPYAIWLPTGDKILAGYHYLTNLPLAGLYDLKENSFTAISVFPFYDGDIFIDDLRLMGARISSLTDEPSWQLSFFTLEDNAKLSTIRIITEAHSPTFFGDDLLPSGNTFNFP